MQAAVRDAERCLGGASGLLGRAVQLGPHPYATLSLPAALVSSSSSSSSIEGQPAAQVLKTPFQVGHPSACNDFRLTKYLRLLLILVPAASRITRYPVS
jgi:hypothetical protein